MKQSGYFDLRRRCWLFCRMDIPVRRGTRHHDGQGCPSYSEKRKSQQFRRWLLILPLLASSPGATSVQAQLPPEMQEVQILQRLGEQVPLDLRFRDEQGKSVTLGEYCGAKPVILVLAYYRCPRLCSQVLNGLADTLRRMSLQPGQDYIVVTVSFDPADTPASATAKKEALLPASGPLNFGEHWHFLTGEETNIKQLAAAVGFRYTHDPETNQFRHAAGIMVLTPGGTVARYFFGIQYPPRDVQFALVEASANRVGSPVDQVLLLTCFAYNPDTGTYAASAFKLMRAGAVVTLICLGLFLGWNWWRERKKGKANAVQS
jgi:protein SCO1/2